MSNQSFVTTYNVPRLSFTEQLRQHPKVKGFCCNYVPSEKAFRAQVILHDGQIFVKQMCVDRICELKTMQRRQPFTMEDPFFTEMARLFVLKRLVIHDAQLPLILTT